MNERTLYAFKQLVVLHIVYFQSIYEQNSPHKAIQKLTTMSARRRGERPTQLQFAPPLLERPK